MASPPGDLDTAAEFQRRRLLFLRIAGIWTVVLAAALALGAMLYYTAGTLKQNNPGAYWTLGGVLLVSFGAAALRIHRAYERLFSCPRCSHAPQANELGIVLFLGWRAAGMDPSSCRVCGAKLK
jgi:hypothetical protein